MTLQCEVRVAGDRPRSLGNIVNTREDTKAFFERNYQMAQVLADYAGKLVWLNCKRDGYIVESMTFVPREEMAPQVIGE